MKYIIHKKNVEMTKKLQDYIEEKLGKLEKYFNKPEEINVTVMLKKKGIQDAIEVTVPLKKNILRAEESNKDITAAIDKVVDKLDLQIKKYNTKMRSKRLKDTNPEDNKKNENIIGQIVKRKGLYSKPMNEDEAILQMELIDHDFYIFFNSETNNYSVVYKRKDGNYGILDVK